MIADSTGVIARSANVLPPPISEAFRAAHRQVRDDERYHFIEHAERAAIFEALRAKRDLGLATLYCTRFPCSDCARAIVWAGIRRVVLSSGFGSDERWLDAQRAALQILREGGVTTRYVRSPEFG